MERRGKEKYKSDTNTGVRQDITQMRGRRRARGGEGVRGEGRMQPVVSAGGRRTQPS